MKKSSSIPYLVIFALVSLALIFLSISCAPTNTNKSGFNRKEQLKKARTWMYQIQDLERKGAIRALSKTNYDFLVLDPTRTVKGSEEFDTKGMIKQLRTKPNGKRRIVLAYIDIGEAEDYRTYWHKNWRPPTDGKQGRPNFLITSDPDGWSGNYPVAYWDKRWKEIWLGRKGLIQSLAKDGFDGVYLDWVEAYDDEKVVAAARKEQVSPAREMVKFIKALKNSGHQVVSDFLVVAQNAPYLLNEDKQYSKIIDALAVEDTWFRGEADAGWDDPNGGDIPNSNVGPWSTTALIKQYRKYQKSGLPVFSVDYCLKKANAVRVYDKAYTAGLIPLVTRVSLSKITQTPPPKF